MQHLKHTVQKTQAKMSDSSFSDIRLYNEMLDPVLLKVFGSNIIVCSCFFVGAIVLLAPVSLLLLIHVQYHHLLLCTITGVVELSG